MIPTPVEKSFGEYTKLTIKNEAGVSFTVIPEMGARLNNFVIPLEEGLLDIIDGYSSPKQLDTEYYSKSSLLAPFPNRIADGKYEFQDQTYQLPINKTDENNSIHGFLSNKKFTVIDSKTTEFDYMISLKCDSAETDGFPFEFSIVVTYILKGQSLTIKSEIKNTGSSEMPIGFGWHPYFTFGTNIDKLKLKLPAVLELVVDDRLIPTGKFITNNEWNSLKLIGKHEFDTGFQFLDSQRMITLTNIDFNGIININCGESFDYVQLFTPPWRTSIAIEPMTCAANAFNNQLGSKTLCPGESLTTDFEINFQVYSH